MFPFSSKHLPGLWHPSPHVLLGDLWSSISFYFTHVLVAHLSMPPSIAFSLHILSEKGEKREREGGKEEGLVDQHPHLLHPDDNNHDGKYNKGADARGDANERLM